MDTYKIQPRFLINFFLLFSFAAASLLATTSSNAASPQAQEALANNPALEYAPDSVLVKFKPAASSAQKMNARALVSGEKIHSYGLVQGLEHMQLGRGQGVESAIKIHNTGQRIRNIRGNRDADIDAPEAWDITTVDPTIVIAVIDTGVEYTHADLANNVWINPGEINGDRAPGLDENR